MTFDLLIDIFKFAHGSFNALLAFVFVYQAWAGLTIRKGRKKGGAMKYKKWLFTIIVALIAIFSTLNAEASVTVATIDKDGVQKVEIIGGSYFFKPNHIVVKVGIPVELKVSKEWSLIPHDIIAKSSESGLEFQESLSSTPKIIRFTANRIGTYPFYCSKKAPFSNSHREKGMAGVIEVVP